HVRAHDEVLVVDAARVELVDPDAAVEGGAVDQDVRLEVLHAALAVLQPDEVVLAAARHAELLHAAREARHELAAQEPGAAGDDDPLVRPEVAPRRGEAVRHWRTRSGAPTCRPR